MVHTSCKVCNDMGVAFLLAPITTGHTFQIVIHHFFSLTLRVAFCLAVASDCKSFHFNDSFTCGSRPHQAVINWFFIINRSSPSVPPRVTKPLFTLGGVSCMLYACRHDYLSANLPRCDKN